MSTSNTQTDNDLIDRVNAASCKLIALLVVASSEDFPILCEVAKADYVSSCKTLAIDLQQSVVLLEGEDSATVIFTNELVSLLTVAAKPSFFSYSHAIQQDYLWQCECLAKSIKSADKAGDK